MRYATFTRADGTIDVFVLLSDGTIDHWREGTDTGPLTRELLPGTWLAMRQPFLWQNSIVLRGVGTDKAVWQTLWDLTPNSGWSTPAVVIR